MNLHDNPQLFADAISFASRPVDEGGLGIREIFIEKDYWICRSLKLMAQSDNEKRAVFKGGTSLAKAYGIGARFSEDIDVAIAEAWNLSGNQLKNLIRKTAHNMTAGLQEIQVPGKTSKGSHYHKAYYSYPRITDTIATTAINPGQILVEINSFANPYPCERRIIQCFLTTFFSMSGNEDLIEEYNLQPFEVTVLDKRRTLVEKLVSLVRCSLASDHMSQLTAKIRHFYDLHFLVQDKEILHYLNSSDFYNDFDSLLEHDRAQFSKPDGWQGRDLSVSPLLVSLDETWHGLESTYRNELADLAYVTIPSAETVIESARGLFALLQRN